MIVGSTGAGRLRTAARKLRYAATVRANEPDTLRRRQRGRPAAVSAAADKLRLTLDAREILTLRQILAVPQVTLPVAQAATVRITAKATHPPACELEPVLTPMTAFP